MARERAYALQYLNLDADHLHELHWRCIRMLMASAARLVVTPVQDVLGLGSPARMNTPGKEQGNWTWRFTEDAFNHDGKNRLSHLTGLYQRRPDQQAKVYGDIAVKRKDDTRE